MKATDTEKLLFEATVCFPKPTGTLKINENFSIALYDKMPNRFHRWMAHILLGWEYKEENSDGH